MSGQARYPIVGVGAVASVGGSADEIYTSLCAGVSGLAPMRAFRRDWYTAGHLFEIDDRGAGGDVPGRATAFLLDAVGQALADAGVPEVLGDVPVLVGTGLRELRSVELWWRDGAPLHPDELDFGAQLHRRFAATSTHTFANACAASLYALGLATDLLASGAADTVVVAGTDAITESMFGCADRVQSVPPGSLRPFDVDRGGTILGEGAAAVVLRRVPGAGDRIRGWVRGVEVNCDAYHATAPDPDNIARAIRGAHARAGVTPADIDLVMLHGTGTNANDEAEAQAIGAVFGPQRGRPVMTAVKSMTGHTSGASGLHGLIVALSSMRAGRVPPTPTLGEPIDAAADLRITRQVAVCEPARVAQVDAFGFGGINAVAIVEVDGE